MAFVVVARSALVVALLGASVGASVASADWLAELGLEAHRDRFESLGIQAADHLAFVEEADAAELGASMKKYEQLRFARALQEAKRLQRQPMTTSAAVGYDGRDARALSALPPTTPHAAAETQLKADLLLNYDKTVPGQAPVQVQLGINLHHIYELDLQKAVLVLHLWLRLAWVDPRLSWDPALYNGIETIAFVASPVALEESQIWVPEVELYSGAESTYGLPRKEVIVSHNGTTFWSRPGKISSVCQLDGLQDFPFDTITCPMRFGGWSLGGSYQNLTLFDASSGIGAADDTMASIATFQEYRIASTTVHRGVDSFSCCPDENGWPYVEYVISFQRAEKHYDMKLIMMNIVLTYLSCGVFLLDPRTGERLQFSTTILLTVVAADSLVTGIVPVCVPVLWIEYFFLVCWTTCILSIIGNMMTHWLFYKSPPEVYASGMPRARAIHLWIERQLHRKRPSRHDSDGKGGAMPSSMWRRESETGSAGMLTAVESSRAVVLPPHTNSPNQSSSSLPGFEKKLSSGSAGGGSVRHLHLPAPLQRGRTSSQMLRVPTNPFLEPNTPYNHTFRRQKSGWQRQIAPPSPNHHHHHHHHHHCEHMPSLEEASGLPPASSSTTSPSSSSQPRRLQPAAVRFADASVVADEARPQASPEKPAAADDAAAAASSPSSPATAQGAAARWSQGSGDSSVSGGSGGEGGKGKSKLKHITRQVMGDIEVKKGIRKYPRISRIASVLVRQRFDEGDGGGTSSEKSSSNRKRVAPFEGAFVGSEELADQVTATELDPVQAALVRKAFRLLDSMSTALGVLGPEQMRYFANHMGKLPTTAVSEAKLASGDDEWQIEEFSDLCLALIKKNGDDKFRVLVEGLLESYEYKAKLHKIYWEGWALWLDYVCFTTLTFAFTVALIVLSATMRNISEPVDQTHAF